jgi:hypothetical protein
VGNAKKFRTQTGDDPAIAGKGTHRRLKRTPAALALKYQMSIARRKLLRDQLRYTANLLDNVNDAIVASDVNYCLTAWNAAAEAMY